MKRAAKAIDQGTVRLEDEREQRVLSRKELARERRRALYQRAKEWRATDPRHLAMKETVKQQRRATYQRAKVQRKAGAASEKAKRKAQCALQRSDHRTERDRELSALVVCLSKGSTASN